MGSLYDACTAFKHYADAGVDIINCSWGARRGSKMLQEAIDYAVNKGVIVICSAGNDYHSYVSYPASYDSTIAVSAVDSGKELAYFSNIGSEVEFTGPGVNVMVDAPEN